MQALVTSFEEASRLTYADPDYGIKTQAVEVRDGIVHWDDRLKLPVRPMIGVAGWHRCTVRC